MLMTQASMPLPDPPEPTMLVKGKQILAPDLIIADKAGVALEEGFDGVIGPSSKTWEDWVTADVGVFHHKIGTDSGVGRIKFKLSGDMAAGVV